MTRTQEDSAVKRTKAPSREIRLLSFNIQAGSSIEAYRQYLTRGWQNFLNHAGKRRNLEAIGKLATDFDLVALQEADAGSLRSGFVNQVHHLAEAAGFEYWSHQPNRPVAKLAYPSNGLLSRLEPSAVLDHKLPGRIPGRGVLEVRFGRERDGLRVLIAHLSLTARARLSQLHYIADVVGKHPHVILMGDLNCTVESRELQSLFSRCTLRAPDQPPSTFPSWQPRMAIDHILLSEGLEPKVFEALPLLVSDHLPLAVTVRLPESCRL